jgi:hypothetical protein
MNKDTDIEVIEKPLPRIGKMILNEDLKGSHCTIESLAKAAGCHRDSVTKYQALPQYIKEYNRLKDIADSKITSIAKHSVSELKTAMVKLKGLVESDPSLTTYAGYVKLLTDVAKNTVDIEDTTTDEDLDIDGTRSDLIALFKLIEEGISPAPLVDYYLDNGKPPTEEELKSPSFNDPAVIEIEEDIDSPPHPQGLRRINP